MRIKRKIYSSISTKVLNIRYKPTAFLSSLFFHENCLCITIITTCNNVFRINITFKVITIDLHYRLNTTLINKQSLMLTTIGT